MLLIYTFHSISEYLQLLFATMRNGVPRINACIGSRRMVYFEPAQTTIFIQNAYNQAGVCLLFAKKETFYLERGSFFMAANSPSTQIPCLNSQLPSRPLRFLHPPRLLPAYRAFISLSKDAFNHRWAQSAMD
jgi:hypothetical protein